MFIFIIGDRGDGKTLTATKFINESKKAIANFPVKKKSAERLKIKHVFEDKNPDAKTQKDRWRVAWNFWDEKKGYSVFIDEAYMQMDSREKGIKNKIWSSWMAQSRKFLGDQGKSRTLQTIFRLNNTAFNKIFPLYLNSISNFFVLSQTTRRIDVNFRELVNVIISCEQISLCGEPFTLCHCWHGDKFVDALTKLLEGVKSKRFMINNKKWYGEYDTNFFSREVEIDDPEGYL